jgi:hypothetical protein
MFLMDISTKVDKVSSFLAIPKNTNDINVFKPILVSKNGI